MSFSAGELDKAIVDRVVSSYVNSHDFNGLRASDLLSETEPSDADLRVALSALVEDGRLAISLYINPHILAFDHPVDKQVAAMQGLPLNKVVLYPTPRTIRGRVPSTKYRGKPYTRQLLQAQPCFLQCFFELAVLDRYRNDPRYRVQDDGTTLHLSIRDKFYLDPTVLDEDKIGIEHLGYGYDQDGAKAVMVFLRDLRNLSSRHQQHWQSHQLKGTFKADRDYLARSFEGEFTETRPLSAAILEEVRQLNLLARTIGKPPLFRNEYDDDAVPELNTLPRPTLANLNAFIHALDKVISENLNKDFFGGEVPPKDEQGQSHGTLKLLDLWLHKRFRPKNPTPMDEMLMSFREIRRLRQSPAHAVDENDHDSKYIREQERLLADGYAGLRVMRLILMNHPLVVASKYEPPEWLQKADFKL